MSKPKTYYKVLKPGGVPPIASTRFRYDLPKNGQPGSWTPPVELLARCHNGYHVTSLDHLGTWIPWRGLSAGYGQYFEIYEVEIRGKKETYTEKTVCQEIRLVKKVFDSREWFNQKKTADEAMNWLAARHAKGRLAVKTLERLLGESTLVGRSKLLNYEKLMKAIEERDVDMITRIFKALEDKLDKMGWYWKSSRKYDCIQDSTIRPFLAHKYKKFERYHPGRGGTLALAEIKRIIRPSVVYDQAVNNSSALIRKIEALPQTPEVTRALKQLRAAEKNLKAAVTAVNGTM